MCACILHKLLIHHAIPWDLMLNSMDSDEEERLEHHSENLNDVIIYKLIFRKFAKSQIKLNYIFNHLLLVYHCLHLLLVWLPYKFLLHLGCIMLLHSRAWHFSKLSSAFRHLECSLHVGSIWALTKKINVFEFESPIRIKNAHPAFKLLFWVLQSDLVSQK